MSNTLKPCPFCGAAACLAEDAGGWYVYAVHIETPNGDECPLNVGWRIDPFYGRLSETRLAAAWNRRPSDEAAPGDAEGEAEYYTRVARVAWATGQHDEAERLRDMAAERFRAERDALRARLAEAESHRDRAVELIRELVERIDRTGQYEKTDTIRLRMREFLDAFDSITKANEATP